MSSGGARRKEVAAAAAVATKWQRRSPTGSRPHCYGSSSATFQGGSVSAYLEEAMKPTDGATDEHVKRLNTVVTSLEPFNPRMRAMGLVQPHVRRTELRSLPRDSFDPAYIKGAEEVRGFVFEHAISRRQQQQQGQSGAVLPPPRTRAAVVSSHHSSLVSSTH